ncbi:AlpA family phage regulatory protein [Bradyrhizobium sp. AS23.2]|uniref:helix-turn-helix transcriptional regulator n=1 Tax=Bradyrhizobium sp. AS23.2 TaxID=1680155 RepID=UPI0009392552|nr:AlpA family phage regulatory protein [Bradyrhizobium sp. AS23.2]
MDPANKRPEIDGTLIAELEKSGVRKMLREAEVLMITSVSPATLWRMVTEDRFPPPTFISPNSKRWFMDEVIAWQQTIEGRDRSEARRQAQLARRKREREAAAQQAKQQQADPQRPARRRRAPAVETMT